jgi:pantetheine-phosphate adenylyltransferase
MPTRRLAVYPGTFDPPTLGHLDVVRRGLAVFGRVAVAVTDNPGKQPLLAAAERIALLKEATADLEGVTVEAYNGLTVLFAKQRGACAILRGIRTMSDLDFESHLALTNRAMSGIETVFVLSDGRYSFITSTLVREIARMGGDVSAMVPPCVLKALRKKYA